MNNIKFWVLSVGCWVFTQYASAQKISDRLQKAYQRFESDSQLRHAISSLYVINAKTGEVVFAYAVNKKNSLHGRQTAAEACAKHMKESVAKN